MGHPAGRSRPTRASSRPRQGAAIQALVSIRGVRVEGAAAEAQAVDPEGNIARVDAAAGLVIYSPNVQSDESLQRPITPELGLDAPSGLGARRCASREDWLHL